MSDVLCSPISFVSAQLSPSARVGHSEHKTTAPILSLELVSDYTHAITSPILVKHHFVAFDAGSARSPAAFSAAGGESRTEAFVAALKDALDLAGNMVAEGDGDPIDHQVLIFAADALLPFVQSLQMPCPLVLPLQNGGIGAEWHDFGLNIELRFRSPFNVYAVVEDARHILPTYRGRDPFLSHAETALRELGRRASGEPQMP